MNESLTSSTRADSDELSHMRAQLRTVMEKYHSLSRKEWWARFYEMGKVQQAILNGWTREHKMSLLQFMLKPGTEITLELTDEWLHTLLLHNPGVLAEAQRLKVRMPQIPWHARRAADEGESYWLRLAGSYQGD